MITLTIKPGKEKSLLRKHPWVYSGSISSISKTPQAGETVLIESGDGKFLGWGAYSPDSKIRSRIWSWDESDIINRDFFERRLKRSIKRRVSLISDSDSNCARIVYAESDGIPGLIVDRYQNTLVLQSLSCGTDYWLRDFTDLVIEITGGEILYERSDVSIRKLEGLDPRSGLLRNKLKPGSNNIPQLIEIKEDGIRYLVDYQFGHKTGFYLDQKTNRKIVRGYADNKDVLDCFSYSGGFALNCLAGNARSVTVIEESADALGILNQNLALNGMSDANVNIIQGDVFRELRKFRDKGLHFDMIILDPPKFAPSATSYQNAARGYKDINLLAMKLVKPGGNLITFSCSGGISEELFQKIIAGAAIDANRYPQIIHRLYQSQDHPVALNFPQGSYLKGYVLVIE